MPALFCSLSDGRVQDEPSLRKVQRFFWVRGERVFVLAGYDESIFVRVSDTGLEERVFPFGYKMVYEHNVFPVSGFPPTSYITAPFKLVVILLANEERLYYRPGAEVKLGYQINKDAELGEWASEVVIWDETGEKRGISFADTTEGTVGVSQSGRVVVVRSTIIRAGESTIYTLGENFVSIWQPVFPDIGFVAGGRGKLALVSLAEERPVGWEMEWQVKCAGLCADGCLIAVDDCGIWLSQAPIKSIGEQEAAKQKEKDGL